MLNGISPNMTSLASITSQVTTFQLGIRPVYASNPGFKSLITTLPAHFWL